MLIAFSACSRWKALDDENLGNDNADWLPVKEASPSRGQEEIYDRDLGTFSPSFDHESKACAHYVRTPNALTIIGSSRYRNTQLLACERRRPIDLLMDFDIDACACAYDGKQVYVLPRARRAFPAESKAPRQIRSPRFPHASLGELCPYATL
jgi:hypothetical protein